MNKKEIQDTDKLRKESSKLTNIAAIVAVATGIALSGQIEYGDHEIAWNIPDVLDPWLTALFAAASAIAGSSKRQVKKLKKILS